MAFHELCTNARKYGALSSDRGRVNLDWSRTEGLNTQLRIVWRESGGPVVTAPLRRGFGSNLLKHTLARDLSGKVTVNFEASGVQCSILLPIDPSPPL
jgi:two-component sensor histidine kinase